MSKGGVVYTRHGFNGKEFDWEVKGWMNQVDYGFRIHDPRIGRFLSIGPLTKKSRRLLHISLRLIYAIVPGNKENIGKVIKKLLSLSPRFNFISQQFC